MSFPMKNGGSFQFVMWLRLPEGIRWIEATWNALKRTKFIQQIGKVDLRHLEEQWILFHHSYYKGFITPYIVTYPLGYYMWNISHIKHIHIADIRLYPNSWGFITHTVLYPFLFTTGTSQGWVSRPAALKKICVARLVVPALVLKFDTLW